MVGKLTTVLAKKEAEAYCAQGLHQEAVTIFSDLLASAKQMDPAIQASISAQLQGIRQAMDARDTRPRRPMSPEEIRRIRDGWGDKATATNTLVCAQAFYQLGAYDEALRELKRLLQSRGAKRIHITAAADCLVRLYLPEHLPAAAEELVKAMRADQKTIWAALVVMAKHVEANHHKEHALALYLHLALIPELAKALQPRIEALSGFPPKARPAESMPLTAPPTQDPPPAGPIAKRRFSLERLCGLLKKRPA
jgi:tetratricopeptide (TPR) repeat protein